MKIIIPNELKGKDIYTVNGKISVTDNLTLKEAKELKIYFPDVLIIEDVVDVKKKITKE